MFNSYVKLPEGTSARIPSPAWWTSGRGGDLCLHHPAFRSAHVPGRSQWQHPVALCDGSQRRGPVGDTAGDTVGDTAGDTVGPLKSVLKYAKWHKKWHLFDGFTMLCLI